MQVEYECVCWVPPASYWTTLRVQALELASKQKCGDSATFTAVPLSTQEILKENLRMFELVQKHPSHWPPFVPPAKPEVTTTGAGKLFL